MFGSNIGDATEMTNAQSRKILALGIDEGPVSIQSRGSHGVLRLTTGQGQEERQGLSQGSPNMNCGSVFHAFGE